MPTKGKKLTRLCSKEEENESSGEIRCNHGYVLPFLTAWTPRNLGRRYWVCPYYGDSEIDSRSKLLIPKLLEKKGELENALEGFENLAKSKTTLMVDNTIKDDKMKKIEAQLVKLQEDMEKKEKKEKKWKSQLANSKSRENVLWFIILGMCIVLVARGYPRMSLKEDATRLPL